MKKYFFLTGLAIALSNLTAFADGEFLFTTSSRYVWNNYNLLGVPTTNMNVSFLLGSGTPQVDTATGASFVPTNAAALFFGINIATAWNAILTDPNYRLATNSATLAEVVAQTTTLGGIFYNSGVEFPVTGTSSNGGTVTVFMIAWDHAYATAQDAAAAGGAVGWSNPFAYTYVMDNPPGTPVTFSSAAVGDGVDAHFGVVVPEPGIFALAGFGAAAMLIRRRK